MQGFSMYKTMSCHISYLSYIYAENCYDESKLYDYLLVLRDMKLIKKWDSYVKVDFRSNPWNYQPYIIGNNEKLGKGVLDMIFDLYRENFGISIKKINFSDDIRKTLKEIEFDDKCYLIVDVDEKYISNSVFYQKSSNRHALLLKQVTKEKGYCIIDSEKNNEYWIKEEEIERAILSRQASQNIYLINTDGFKLLDSYEKYPELASIISRAAGEIDIYKFFENKISAEKDLNYSLFFLRSLILSLFFQIKPMLLLNDRITVIKGNEGYDFSSMNENLNRLTYLINIYEVKKKININLLDRIINELDLEINKLIRRCYIE